MRRTPLRGRRLGDALAMTVLLGGVAAPVAMPVGPAGAESVTGTDNLNDVWFVDQDDDGEVLGYAKVGRALNVNLVETTLRHRVHGVLVLAYYRDLRLLRSGFSTMDLRFRTEEEHEYVVVATFNRDRPRGTSVLYDETEQTIVECDGLSLWVDYADDVLRSTVPRSCLGDPATVELNAHAWTRFCCENHREDVFDGPGHGRGGWSDAVEPG